MEHVAPDAGGVEGAVYPTASDPQVTVRRDPRTADHERYTTDDMWHCWRGTPQMFAHVIAAGLWWVKRHALGSPQCLIDVEVDGDHEYFLSPDAFNGAVTIQALRHFKSMSAQVTVDELEVRFALEWRRPWWSPGSPGDWSQDADVTLNVQGEAREAVDAVRQRMCLAIARGGASRSTAKHGLVQLGIALVTAAIVTATVVSALYLLKASIDLVLVGAPLFFVSFCVGAVLGAWIFPSIEVAPHRQSNLWRLLKSVGPVAVALILAGVTKKLYG